jgi:hypothetical protein
MTVLFEFIIAGIKGVIGFYQGHQGSWQFHDALP